MARILVTATLPRDGKSVVAAGVAAALRANGDTVRLVRIADSESAQADAQQFTLVNGVRASADPVGVDEVPSDTTHMVIEAGLETSIEVDQTILVVRHGEADDNTVASALAQRAIDAVIVNGVPKRGEAEAIERLVGLGVAADAICAIPQDRHLAAPTVRDLAPALDGALSGDSGLFDEASRDLVIGPVSAHQGMDYFRKYPDKTVISRHDRIDIALGALDYEPLCLVLCGGEPTLPYVAQRAERESFALITTSLSTLEAVEAVGPLFGRSAFVGTRKLETAIELINTHAAQAMPA